MDPEDTKALVKPPADKLEDEADNSPVEDSSTGESDQESEIDEIALEQLKYADDKMEDIHKLAEEMEKCYEESVKEMEELEKFLPRFKALEKNTDKLFKYYFSGPWRSHRERIDQESPDRCYGVHGEDLIYNLVGDMQDLAKKNMREMALYMTDEKDY